MASHGQILVSVANIYREPTYMSDVVTQGLLGEDILVLERRNSFSRIRLPDMYEGWISDQQWVSGVKTKGDFVRVRSHHIQIKMKPQRNAESVRDATIGAKLSVIGRRQDWIQVQLPDGVTGWIHAEYTGPFPDMDPETVESMAREFLGYPYFWGGKSPKGFDCSGFTQTVFFLFNVQLPRDSWMQREATVYVSRNAEDARKGDLYFFAETGERITHVGIALGQKKIIHARGFVRINSLDANEPDFNPDLLKTLVDVRRIRLDQTHNSN